MKKSETVRSHRAMGVNKIIFLGHGINIIAVFSS